ncbi:hypothetical protein GY45DRAFT_150028 [Cubamyces sp. BRFM 1775]|nr:hypothetical protein GY45DRAFT_150028 [Cubamyces sp. BRFM 1775]
MARNSPSASESKVQTEDAQGDLDVIRRDCRYYTDHIVFQVENCLFKVPQRKFVDDSEVFKGMFALPADSKTVEGQTDEKPIVLVGIKKEEFQALLHVMFTPLYGPSLEEQRQPTLEEWISVLKLTTMWQFARQRRVAIDRLCPLLEAANIPARWLWLARQYDVDEWLFPALHALARRTQPIQVEEAESLGIATAIKMAEVRESFTRCSVKYNYQIVVSRSQYDFTAKIMQVFRDELRAEAIGLPLLDRSWDL